MTMRARRGPFACPMLRATVRCLRDRRGVSLIEFALGLPLLTGLMLGGLEMANYVIALTTTQRMATMTADLVAQSGVGGMSTTEAQLYDTFSAIDAASRPIDLRKNGRMIFTVVKGERQSDNSVKNVFADATYAQQFDGNYVAATPLLGCHTTVANPVFSRVLAPEELLVHVQVTYNYQPLFARSALDLFNASGEITRTASFRLRKNAWNIINDGNHPAKSNCTTATGL